MSQSRPFASLRVTPFFFCILFSVFSSGCGYTQKTVLPNNIKTIYVNTVQNKIPVNQIFAYQPGLEMMISKAVVNRLNRDGTLLVAPKEKADAVLQTFLINFQQEGLRFNTLEQVEETRLFVVVAIKLVDKSGKVLWEEPNFSGYSEYFISDVRSVAREEAAQQAMQRLAKNVVDRIVEDW